MTQEHYYNIHEEVGNWIGNDEEIIAITFGSQQGPLGGTVVALTSKNLHIGSSFGNKVFPLNSVKSIDYSGLWARLNIRISDPKEKFVLAIDGKFWKNHSKELVTKWETTE